MIRLNSVKSRVLPSVIRKMKIYGKKHVRALPMSMAQDMKIWLLRLKVLGTKNNIAKGLGDQGEGTEKTV